MKVFDLTMTPDDFAAHYSPLPRTDVPQRVMDDFFRFGSNTSDCRLKVVSLFSKHYAPREIISGLSALYHGGYGIVEDGRPYSVWYDDYGVRFMPGNSAKDSPDAHLLTWGQVSDRLSAMLREGTFTTRQEIDAAPSADRKEIAESLWYMYRDISDGHSDLLRFMQGMTGGGFQDDVKRIADYLADPASVDQAADDMARFLERYRADSSILRFRYHNPSVLLRRIVHLRSADYACNSSTEALDEPQSFITEDEINAALRGGSGFSDGKLRIYRFFADHAAQAERASFLRNEYGVGGRSHAVSGSDRSGEDHGASGITLKKGVCDPVQLSWKNVAERIAAMIGRDEYLTQDESIAALSEGIVCMEPDEFAEQYAACNE